MTIKSKNFLSLSIVSRYLILHYEVNRAYSASHDKQFAAVKEPLCRAGLRFDQSVQPAWPVLRYDIFYAVSHKFVRHRVRKRNILH